LSKALVSILSVILAIVAVGARPAGDTPVRLRDLVPAGDPLARQDLTFDARFARTAIEYVRVGHPALLDALAASPAARHLLNHATQFDYDVPKDSPRSLVNALLAPSPALKTQADQVEGSLAFFTGPLIEDPHWVNDVLRYLPAGFRFRGSLYLTFGYDIGVALAPNASLNGASGRFAGRPRELLYYAIHELHHVGVNTYQPPPRISDIKTCADLLRLVDYSTELEGLAVYVARARRAAEGALGTDPDYVALENPARMIVLEQQYDEQYRYLQRRGVEPVDNDAWAVLDRMSSGDRLWYRVGALMAARVERQLGHDALVALVAGDHPALVETYRRLASAR
jgi:Putative zinc dependent peptidase (DUF5700)